jgi:hypothetical protein
MLRKLTVRVFRSSAPLVRIFSHELLKIFEPTSRKSTKFAFEFCGLDLSGKLALVDIATFSCFNQDFSTIFRMSPLPFQRYHEKLFRRLLSRNQPADIFFSVGIPSWVGLSGHSSLLFRASLDGNPSMDGIF